jgi:UDP-galactopyranose mutase
VVTSRANTVEAQPRVLIVGGGLTGCTVANLLAREGIPSLVLERYAQPGGLIRSALMHGVLYEPHGSHIFHTDDEHVWTFANSLTPFNDYRHRVDIMIEGRVLNWPILERDFDKQSRGDEIRRELAARSNIESDSRAAAANFEEWCLDLMGPILYGRYVRPYTIKQWGRAPTELAASWAPQRISVRRDNNPYLFPDRFQGWPASPGGYSDLIDALAAHPLVSFRFGVQVSLADVMRAAQVLRPQLIVLTCPLDEFEGGSLGALPWRGIMVNSVYLPCVQLAQGAMVVNYPALDYPFIRIHETKHASRQECLGTVLGFEFTGTGERHYPIETPHNRRLNDRYKERLRGLTGRIPTLFAGRLANYMYIDMDDCIRQAMDLAVEARALL